ncbi:MAG TPA: monovalent cation/H+ antiporter subunit D, partial [Xanthobacteraceae bacterium]|nr:monovalent cation/H+ antiporter subunit D [Xanthobacteraceae bacterium]
MIAWADHLAILPILLPLAAGAGLLLIEERHRALKAAISLATTLALAGIVTALFYRLEAVPQEVIVYRLAGWPAPFGIVLVVDRLTVLMLILTSGLALASLIFSLVRWSRAGVHYLSLFQFLLMGLNGAFLTGDLFNLFVFFELLLAASYGLALHGSGIVRVRAGLHYIAINLAASLLFLIGVSLIYSATGTLNMADLAMRIPTLDAGDRMLMESGSAILGIAFLVKAGMWPLSFWLPTTYAAAAPPVAAMFAIMSKLGIYVILRLWLLLFGDAAGASSDFGGMALLAIGGATVLFGMIGILASQDLGRLTGFAVLISSGTILAVIAIGDADLTGPAIYYMISSTLAIGAMFMLIELIERGRDPGADMLAVTREAYGDDSEEDPLKMEEIGIAIPATITVLGLCFLSCALVLAGMPPLSGFIGKFAILSAAFSVPGQGQDAVPVTAFTWLLLALLMVSGIVTLMAMTRAGIRTLWIPQERTTPMVHLAEIAPIILLLAGCVALTVQADPVLRYMNAAASAAHSPADYVRGVLTDP